MANGTAAPSLTERRTSREPISVSVIPVDEKRFESEIRRIDTTSAEEKKNREKFETEVLRRFDKVDARFEKTDSNIKDLRGEMNSRFDKMEKSVDTRFDKMEKSVDTRFDKMEKSVDARFDKMEKSVDARFDKVENEIKDLRGEVNTRMDRLDDRLWWIFGAVVFSILLPIVMKYL